PAPPRLPPIQPPRHHRSRPPRRHHNGAVHLSHRQVALGARHRRQRLVLPRHRRSPFLAPVQRPRPRRKDLGRGPPDRPRLHLREHVLVVQYVLHRGLLRHPPPHVPR